MISMLISFLTTFIITPYAIKFLYAAGIVGLDINKKGKPKLPASGGVCVAFGILAGLLSYVGIKTFVYGDQNISIQLLTVVSSILLVTFSGLLDDLNVKSKPVLTKDGMNVKIGFPQWIKPLLTLPAAIPLMVISAGETAMAVPFFGTVDFGIFYPLVIIPLGVVGASNMVNMLGGFNGLEAGMGVIYMLSLGLYALCYGIEIAGVIFLVSFVALLAFLRYNWFPAKILPGDSLTYLLGSTVAAGMIVGNMEKIGIIVMTPFIIQGVLKFYSLLKMKNFASDLGILQGDGLIKSRYGKDIYSWTHLLMNIKPMGEKEITLSLMLVQLSISFLILFFVIIKIL